MSICDNHGNLQEDFISRLDTLRAQQDENIRKLESLRIDAAIQKRKSEQTRIEAQNLTPPDNQINEQIYEMWRDFDLTQRIITLKEQENKADIHSKSDFNGAVARASGSHWTPVVTVPRPFSMTIREDALKTTKTQAAFEIERAKREREKLEMELIECKNKFKARPAPPETVYPLYHDLVEQSENRRRIVRDIRKEELQNILKPFSFAERDEKKAREKARKIREQRDEQDKIVLMASSTFKATELDKSILENSFDPETEEMERKKRIRERSEKLMRSASAGGLERVLRVQSAKEPSPARKPLVSATPVPDFETIHKRNAKKMQKAKIAAEDERSRRPKSAAPNLYSNQRVKTRPKIEDEPLNNSFKATKITFKMEPTPIRENEVYCKRKKFIDETLELLERQIDEQKAADKLRKKRARSRARELHKKLPSRDQSLHEDRTKRLIEQEKQREEEYRQTLQDIYKKVDSRPLLFEQKA